MNLARRAAFLDRDGVINVDTGYVYRIDDFEFIPGAVRAIQQLYAQNYQIVVITNQSGIGRGYFSEQDFTVLTDWMTFELTRASIEIVHTYHCPHSPAVFPDLPCDCRKPKPGMILRAAQDLGLDLGRSILIGDKPTDIMAGCAAGVGRCFQVGQTSPLHPAACGEFADLAAFVEWSSNNDEL